jgi:hypothetical protein
VDGVSPRQHDPLLRVLSNSAFDSRGIAFGLQGNLYFPVVISGLFSIGIFTLLLLKTGYPVPKALGIAAIPFAATLIFILLLLNGKKPHYASDLFLSFTSDGSFGRPFGQPKHPVIRSAEAAAKANKQSKAARAI